MSRRKIGNANRSHVNARRLRLVCSRMHELLFGFVLIYKSEKVLQEEKEKPRIKGASLKDLRGLLI